MASDDDLNQLLERLRSRGTASAQELATALGRSQQTLSRWLAAAGDQVARFGRARYTRYAATRDVRGLGYAWPIYRIDEEGRPEDFGQLVALHGDACLVEFAATPDWLRGEFRHGYFPGLPWFLDDMRPQGFLGRQFAHRIANDLGLADDLHVWSVDAVLAALLLRGADAPGQFILGDHALRTAVQQPPACVNEAERSAAYAKLADAAMAGAVFGSSAAGEQPKFTTCVLDANGQRRHVIVKFSERITDNPVARRWADLLTAEHIAAQVLAAHGHASARTQLVASDDRLCLEVTRFDRAGRSGRRGVVTLAAWSDAHDGLRDNWAAAAARMQKGRWIDADTQREIRLRWWFGQLIGNTDMHFGNLAFHLQDHLPLRVAPCYDMLPMRYAPASSGAMYAQALTPSRPLPADRDAWSAAAALAETYWQTLADADALQDEFRAIAAENGRRITQERAHA